MAKRTCLLCHTQYSYCPHCSKDADKPRWMMMFHNENCEQIFDILQRHEQNIYSDEEAIKRMKERDLSVLKGATETVRNQVNQLLAKEVKNTEETKEVKPSNGAQKKVDTNQRATIIKR